ncbi:MAG: hypothetical protein ACRDQ7_14660 [Haloechinothrix sp.]
MGTGRAWVDVRRRKAREALSALGSHRSDRRKLSIQCSRSHHVAFVYDTEAGLVYSTVTGPHAHGSRDFVDTAHHGGRRGAEYVDLLEAGPMVDDELPAWCECGPRTLSRSELDEHITAERRKLRLS